MPMEDFPLIREVLLCCLLAGAAMAQPPPSGEVPPRERDTSIERYKTSFEKLNERKVGEASRAVRFDWRNARVAFGVFGGGLLELNNFSTARVGGFARKSLGNFTLEAALSYAHTWGSDSTAKLNFTPYRQLARPSRLELDLGASYALAEGVVTPRLGVLPALEMVFNVNVGLRYLFYPGSLAGLPAGDTFATFFAPLLSDKEIANLEPQRLPGMKIERSRYSLLAGFSLDVYMPAGIFFTPRVMLGVPSVASFSGEGLGFWWELNFALGVAL